MESLIGRKIICETDSYRSSVPRGTELVVTTQRGDIAVDAVTLDGDGFEWCFMVGEYRLADEPTQTTTPADFIKAVSDLAADHGMALQGVAYDQGSYSFMVSE